ncbi:hypothetical protein [uncultured Methanocorpusculum sp.]|nr:hypothetical protein [uncultured Methanocorpusculum sp.]
MNTDELDSGARLNKSIDRMVNIMRLAFAFWCGVFIGVVAGAV